MELANLIVSSSVGVLVLVLGGVFLHIQRERLASRDDRIEELEQLTRMSHDLSRQELDLAKDIREEAERRLGTKNSRATSQDLKAARFGASQIHVDSGTEDGEEDVQE